MIAICCCNTTVGIDIIETGRVGGYRDRSHIVTTTTTTPQMTLNFNFFFCTIIFFIGIETLFNNPTFHGIRRRTSSGGQYYIPSLRRRRGGGMRW